MSANAQQILVQNIKAAQKDSGLGKGHFALLLGITRQELDKILDGHANVKLETLEKMAAGLGMEPWELLKPRT